MQENVFLQKHIDDDHKEIDGRFRQLELNMVEHGGRLNSLEKEMNTMNANLMKIQSSQEKMHDKFDTLGDAMNEFRVSLPTILSEVRLAIPKAMEEVAEKVKDNTDKSFDNCRAIQDAKNSKLYISIPEGVKGTVVRLGLVLIASLAGLDLSGAIDITGKDSPKQLNYSKMETAQSVLPSPQRGHGYNLNTSTNAQTNTSTATETGIIVK